MQNQEQKILNFDPETSLSFEGDSGPYLQYTHARITSLLEKGAGLGITPKYHSDQEVSDVERNNIQTSWNHRKRHC